MRIASVIFFLCFVAGCSFKPSPQTTQQQILNLNIGAEPTVLNPILYTDGPSAEVVGLVFSGLLKTNENLELEPDLCESYDIQDGGRRVVFKLRTDVTWHDGHPFTADDVKFTFDRVLDKKTNTVRRSGYLIDGKPIRWRVINRHTIEARLPAPFGPFLVRAAMEILPKHLLENTDINTAAFNRNPIGTGPFKFQEWKPSQYIKLVRNDHYYGGKPKLDGILLKIIPDANTAMLALKRQEIHQNQILAKDYRRFKRIAYLDIHRWFGLNYSYVGFNLKRSPFSDLKFRQAIAHAINKQALVKSVLNDFGRPAYYPSSPVSWAYPDQHDLPVYDYSPEKSVALFQELGYVRNDETGWFEDNGRQLEFTLITNKGNKDRERSCEIIQQFLANVGIKINIQLMEWSSFIKIINAGKDPKEFDMVLLGWSLGLDPDSYSVWHSSQYPNGFNMNGYSNKTVDFLLNKARQLPTNDQRKPIYYDLFSEIAQDVPYIFLYHTETLSGVNTRVRGLSKPGPAGLMNRIERVHLVP